MEDFGDLPRHKVDIENAKRQQRLPQSAKSRVTEVISPITFFPILSFSFKITVRDYQKKRFMGTRVGWLE